MPDQHLAEVRARERQSPGGHLVHHAAQRIDVAAAVDLVRLPRTLLRRHVRRRAHHHAGLRLAGGIALVVGDAGDAEVDDLDEVLLSLVDDQVDVVGLQVAVHDALAVRGLERLAALHQDRPGDFQRDGDVLPEQVLHRPALEELHHEVVAVVLGDVSLDDFEDVFVADDVDGPRFVVEAVDDPLVVRVLRV